MRIIPILCLLGKRINAWEVQKGREIRREKGISHINAIPNNFFIHSEYLDIYNWY